MNELKRLKSETGKSIMISKSDKDSKLVLANIDDYKRRIQEEINILKSIDHPHIINLYEVFEDKRNIHLIMEECKAGTLIDRVLNQENKKLTERKVSEIMESIIKAINHIHSLGICHRDLKPENILFVNKNDDTSLKLIDFGLGKNLNDQNDKSSNFVGSPHYVAPEILNGGFDIKCDIWSAGVIMYNLLSGQMPFNGKDTEEIYEEIKKENVCFPPKCKK